MSRIVYADYPEEAAQPPHLFDANLRRALGGQRGQRALRDLIAALEALPEKRLINDDIMGRPSGEVCAVGAYALYKAAQRGYGIYADREDFLYHLSDIDTDYETIWEAERWGMTRTLAWALTEMNDEQQDGATDEERYEAILRWARERLIEEAA